MGLDLVTASGSGNTLSRITRRNSDGEVLWWIELAHFLRSAVIDHQGNVIAAGDLSSRAWLGKYDLWGNEIWSFRWTQFSNDQGSGGVDVDDSGDIYTSLMSTRNGVGRRLCKVDPDGGLIWDVVENVRFFRVDRTDKTTYGGSRVSGPGSTLRIDAGGVVDWFNSGDSLDIINRPDIGGPDNEKVFTSWVSTSGRIMRRNAANDLLQNTSYSTIWGVAIDKDSSEKIIYVIHSSYGIRKLRWDNPGQTQLWQKFDDGSTVTSGAIEYIDGRLYFAGDSGAENLYATSPDGSVLWHSLGDAGFAIRSVDGGLANPPAIDNFNAVFSGPATASTLMTWETAFPMDEFIVERERWVDEGFPT